MNKIIRKKNENYTIISNVILRDSRISLKAKGLMALVMSLPPNWDFTIRGLIAIVKEGRDAIYASIKELKQFGYCDVIVCRDERGKLLGNDYVFYEEPQLASMVSLHPYTENPYLDNPDTANPPQISIEENNNLNNNTTARKVRRFTKPSVEDIDAYCKEKGYNIDAEHFWNYYESKGWVVGKSPMKSWKAAIATWIKTDKNGRTKEIKQPNLFTENPSDDQMVRDAASLIDSLAAKRRNGCQ
ncbi:helix-turn-helix domain-containing protein [Prevotella sp. E2-28]|uniref:helix-turn-helix domain-containing protein n=1 Tax=Prevotella sp. E2-28 TaxID=2913620 RepID=UPI001EDB5DB7|nr:helix-turn-helix domain-containing protein [Prevotella sp. E2-28]UKK52637.1 helix-turn-helix domain-containing protein [Prevotella sp. E2-28]